MTRTFLGLLLLALALPGCSWIQSWGDPEPGDPAPLVEFEESLEVRKIWSTDVGDGMGKKGLSMAPVYSSGRLYVADYEGRLAIVDAETGSKVWELKTKQPFSGGPGLDDERIYMGTIDGRVIAYDRETGAELWNAQVSSEVLAPPASADGVVVVRGIDGRVFGLDDISGRRLWIYDHSVPLLTLRGNANLLIRAGIAFVGYDDGSVVSLRVEDGSVLWNQTIVSLEGRTELDRLSDIGTQMVIVASDLIVSSYKNRLASLAADSGRLLWFKDIASASGVVVERTRLAVSDREDELWLLDRRNGSTTWKIDRFSNRQLTRPAFYGNYVVVGDVEGYLHWLDADLGAFVARVRAGKDGFDSPPLSVGTTLYVLTKKGDLVAYRAGAAI
ncbi:MAG: outer membrane protein assembly factor BamB [Xanthomonadales bacterium]|nr:outer membrane protein assembly factor BamB [Gammaproteobacteria bacterium]MBT8052138.1 outer membrane protein assembly factor BamB [Gammaproteobacteria bacterium]MBT8056823.1 outer membrane protein assembly factor BamB [Gammaproteobacteria bacterium]NNJ79473.1 outer membrane protein assembly factor BamB [Xanthomonadales bacterium]NNL05611.1 outer membrane protein assembly factor BamB [Xanthomonadales bacterium]